MLGKAVSGKDCVIGLDDRSLGCSGGVNREAEFCFLPIVDRESFKEERSETTSGPAPNRVVNDKAIEVGALFGEFANPVQAEVYNLRSDCVATPSKVFVGVLFFRNKQLGVKQLSIGT